MDMDGRSLGTERSSTFTGGPTASRPGARVSDALAGGDRFAAVLANRTQHGADSSAEGDVSARIREGRTDAATATYNSREAQDKAWKPRNERTVERTDDSESWELDDAAPEAPRGSEDSVQAPNGRAGTAADHDSTHGVGPETSELSSPSHIQPELDPADALGAAGSMALPPAATGPIGSSATPATPGGALAATQSAASPAFAQGHPQGASGAAASRVQTAQPAQAVQGQTAATAAKAATKAAAPRPSLPPEDARAILNEVRIQILDGKREARIQLRPIELGRLDLLIRVNGGEVVAKIAAENAEALAVLESHAPELRAWLAQDGAESVELEFSLIEPEDQNFAHDGEQGHEAGFESAAERRSFGSAGGPRRATARSDAQGLADPSVAAPRRTLKGGVDFVA